MPDQTGQYGTFPIPTAPRVAAAPGRVAHASRWRSERIAQPRLRVRRSRDINVEDAPRQIYSALVVACLDVARYGSFDDLEI